MKILNTSKRVTLRTIYLGYSYKYRNIESRTIAIPYFPKEEITTHKHSLTFKEWKKIIQIYLKHLLYYLLTTGSKFKIPSRLGYFQLRKYKSRSSPDWGKTREIYGDTNRKPLMYKNIHTQGNKPIIKWYREGQNAKFKYKWYWRFNFTKKTWKTISKEIFSKLSLMNKLQKV